MEITSIFTVTDFLDNKDYEEEMYGYGPEVIKYLRSSYPKFSKFVLEGFEIDGKFHKLDLRTYNYIR